MRDWDPYDALRAPRVPLDLAALPSFPMPSEEDDLDEDETVTLARFIPASSEVRAILEDPRATLAHIREIQASIPDPDSALDSLVKVYEDRVARLAAERTREELPTIAMTSTSSPPKPKARPNLQAAAADLHPHFWKVVYGFICCWGLLQLALTR